MTTNNNGYFSEYNYKPGRNQIETGPPYNFVASNFGVQPQFEEFDYDNNRMSGASNPPEYNGNSLAYYSSHHSYSRYLLASGNIPATGAYSYTNRSFDDYEDEPPLMEELGINLDHILHKTVAVLNPLKETDSTIVQDADLSGPFVFCLIFGTFLLFSGKLHFGYMYGIGMLGCIAMYALLNLMSDSGVSIGCTISVLGYCLLPMVVLSGLSILSLRGMMGTFLSVFTVLWCSLSASKLFVTALDMDHQQLLIAYPCALLYGIFALLTVF